MPIFCSNREKRLWLFTLAAIVAIYSTLGIAGSLAGKLPDNTINIVLFLTGCFLVLATVITHGLKTRQGRIQLTISLGIGAAYLMILTRITSPVERSHLIEYGVVAIFIFEALKERAKHGCKSTFPALVAILIASLLGTIDECLQVFIPNRVFDPVDIFFNVMASVMAVAASMALTWGKERFGKREAR